MAALRNEHFFTREEAQEAVKEKLEELNNRPFKAKEGCRHSAYFEEEREFMKPLPVAQYEPSMWIPNVSVSYDYLVSDGKNKYSVPFDLIGEKVDIRLTRNIVEVFYHSSRVAAHVRKATAQREPIVNPEHMTAEHKKYLNYNSEDFTAWANTIGQKTAEVVKYFLTSGKEVEQGFKACASLTKMADRYGAERLESVCAIVLTHTSAPSVRIISTVLKNSRGKPADPEHKSETDQSNNYGITRGRDYFKRGDSSK